MFLICVVQLANNLLFLYLLNVIYALISEIKNLLYFNGLLFDLHQIIFAKNLLNNILTLYAEKSLFGKHLEFLRFVYNIFFPVLFP